MQASLFPITHDNLSLLHPQARRSVFWELEAEAAKRVEDSGFPDFEKEAWLSTTLYEQQPAVIPSGISTRHPRPPRRRSRA